MTSDPTARGWTKIIGGWERPATMRDPTYAQMTQTLFAPNEDECERLDKRAGIFIHDKPRPDRVP
jgi:hypothetical protein